MACGSGRQNPPKNAFGLADDEEAAYLATLAKEGKTTRDMFLAAAVPAGISAVAMFLLRFVISPDLGRTARGGS